MGILGAGAPLQLACMALHLFGGILGFGATKAAGFDERTCRTVAIETAMKSSAFGFLLASLHFGAFNVRVPSAVSVQTLVNLQRGATHTKSLCASLRIASMNTRLN